MNELYSAYSPDVFRKWGHEIIDILADYLASAQNKNIEAIPWKDPGQSLAYWEKDLLKDPLSSPIPLFKDIIEHSTHLHHPRYMGHQVAVPLPVSALAGLLSSLLNNGMAVYEMGIASTAIEKIILDFMAKAIGFDTSASGFLTSGGTLANLTALLTARAVKAPEDVWTEGSQQKLAIMVSEEAHYCVDRAARIMGLGSEGIIKIPVDEFFQIRTDLLEDYYQAAQNKGLQVIAIIGSACSTSTGTYDDLEELAAFAEKYNVWLHVDGAHGGAAVFSEKYKPLVKGIEKADSVIIDFHKMMMVPALVTAVVYRNGKHSYETFQQKAQYLWADAQEHEWFNGGKRTFECTKLMMSIKVYTLLRIYGPQIFEQNVEALYGLGQKFSQMVDEHPNMELAVPADANIVCFRYISTRARKLNDINSKLRQKIIEKGDFYIVQTMLYGDVFLRVTLMNPLTTEEDLKALLHEVEQTAYICMAEIYMNQLTT